MAWPSPSDYRDAIQNPKICFADPELRDSIPVLDSLGLPKPISGFFASVYQVNCSGKMHAVRCPLRDYPDIEKRYAVISDHLKNYPLPYMVEFAFLQRGIFVRGSWYPILKMEWADGQPLSTYVHYNLSNRQAILRAASEFVKLACDLRNSSIAHGDLQHGNILVTPSGLRLVDYDGMYVPGLAGMSSNELGHRNYQSPVRTEKDFGPHLDSFSEWVIYVSLLSLGLGLHFPNSVQLCNDNLVFRKEDFDDPASSVAFEAFEAFEGSNALALRSLATLLASFSYISDLSLIPPLDDGQSIPHILGNTSTSISPLPEWMTAPPERLDILEASQKPLGADQGFSWIIDNLAPPAQVHIRGSYHEQRMAAVSVLLCGILVAFGAILGLSLSIAIPIVIAFALFIMSAAITGVLFLVRYYSMPEIKDKYRLLSQQEMQRITVSEIESQVGKMQKDLQALDTMENQKTLRIRKALADCAEREKREIAAVEASLQRSLNIADSERQKLHRKLTEEKSEALQTLRNRLLVNALTGYSIDRASIAGIGHVMKSRLAGKGITTAADVSGMHVSASYHGGYANQLAYIEVPGHGSINVEGIGPAKARALLAWRRDIEATIRATLPTSIPAAEEGAIRAKYHSSLQNLLDQDAKAKGDARTATDSIRDKFRQEHSSLGKDLVSVPEEFKSRRASMRAKIGEMRRNLSQRQWALATTDHELKAYRSANFANYVQAIFLLDGR